MNITEKYYGQMAIDINQTDKMMLMINKSGLKVTGHKLKKQKTEVLAIPAGLIPQDTGLRLFCRHEKTALLSRIMQKTDTGRPLPADTDTPPVLPGILAQGMPVQQKPAVQKPMSQGLTPQGLTSQERIPQKSGITAESQSPEVRVLSAPDVLFQPQKNGPVTFAAQAEADVQLPPVAQPEQPRPLVQPKHAVTLTAVVSRSAEPPESAEQTLMPFHSARPAVNQDDTPESNIPSAAESSTIIPSLLSEKPAAELPPPPLKHADAQPAMRQENPVLRMPSYHAQTAEGPRAQPYFSYTFMMPDNRQEMIHIYREQQQRFVLDTSSERLKRQLKAWVCPERITGIDIV